MTRRGGFTLIELLVATLLSVILTAGVLSVAGALARDTRRLQSEHAAQKYDGAIEVIRHDLANARSFAQSADQRSLVIEGHGAIEIATLRPSGRLCRVTYTCTHGPGGWMLSRHQYLLDAPTAPQPWTTSICTGVSAISVRGADSEAAQQSMPALLTIRLAGETGAVERSEVLR